MGAPQAASVEDPAASHAAGAGGFMKPRSCECGGLTSPCRSPPQRARCPLRQGPGRRSPGPAAADQAERRRGRPRASHRCLRRTGHQIKCYPPRITGSGRSGHAFSCDSPAGLCLLLPLFLAGVQVLFVTMDKVILFTNVKYNQEPTCFSFCLKAASSATPAASASDDALMTSRAPCQTGERTLAHGPALPSCS